MSSVQYNRIEKGHNQIDESTTLNLNYNNVNNNNDKTSRQQQQQQQQKQQNHQINNGRTSINNNNNRPVPNSMSTDTYNFDNFSAGSSSSLFHQNIELQHEVWKKHRLILIVVAIIIILLIIIIAILISVPKK
jgi:chromosomal replication initiation ATPase DnaA